MGVFCCIYFSMKIIISESQKEMLEGKEIFNSFLVKKIPVKGYSLFSKKNISEGQKVGKLLTKEKGEIGRKLEGGLYETDLVGRYINHSYNPNTLIEVIDGEVYIFSKKEISEGEEITVDYGEVEKFLGVPPNTYLSNNFID